MAWSVQALRGEASVAAASSSAALALTPRPCRRVFRSPATTSISAPSSSAAAAQAPSAPGTRILTCRSQEDDKSDLPPEFANDVWADEKFNIVGTLFQNFIYVAILLVGLAGGLAAKSYNDGATAFLQKATSNEDKAQIISVEEVQKARKLLPAPAPAPEPTAAES